MLKLITDSQFNYSMYEENVANRWKFLDVMSKAEVDDIGFFVQSPAPILIMTSVYILFVKLVGPIIMRDREPFHLKTPIRFYNLLMVFLAAILFTGLYNAVGSMSNMVDCTKAFSFNDESATKIYQMANFILIVRLSEYLDTIFFTLRKKQNQVTFLHVFHHAFVPMYAYWILRTAPVRFNVFIILINSFIHVLMYSYYFLATFQEPRDPTKKQPKQAYAFWGSVHANKCGIPWTYVIANILLAFGFLGLFLHFYVSMYKSAASLRTKRD